jgi:hypothetical protein
MTMIGKKEQVANLRDIWPTEPRFSDWLVTEAGLSLIEEDIEIRLENPKRESRPGDFPCDIVANERGNEDHIIVIENQFGRTDHDHLGKLLTYTAVHSALTCVWICERASDDRRKVIDWLNDNTPPTVALYLVEITAFRIGDSLPAPQLRIVSRPNLEVKIQKSGGSPEEKELQLWRRSAWEEILSYITAQRPPFNVPRTSGSGWAGIAIGRGAFWIALTLTPGKQRIGCELSLNPVWKEAAFAQLEAQKQAIEAEIGAPLQWEPLPGKKMARIQLEADIDPKDPANRAKVKQWMYEKSCLFYKVFKDRVKKLIVPEDTPLSDDREE